MANMEFLDVLKEKLGETGEFIAKKSVQLVDTTKLNYHITTEQAGLKKKYEAIGKLVFEAKCGNGKLSDEINTLCDDIQLSLNKIEDMKYELQKLKNKTTCPHCGKTMSKDAPFCSACGCKNE